MRVAVEHFIESAELGGDNMKGRVKKDSEVS